MVVLYYQESHCRRKPGADLKEFLADLSKKHKRIRFGCFLKASRCRPQLTLGSRSQTARITEVQLAIFYSDGVNTIGTTVAIRVVMRGCLGNKRLFQDVTVLTTDIIASMDVAVIAIDRHGMLVGLSAGGQELFSLDDSFVGQFLSEITPEPLRLTEAVKECERETISISESR